MGRASPHGLEGVGAGQPPPPRYDRGKYNWEAIAERTREVSPEWYQVFESDKLSLVTQIRNNDVKALTSDKGFIVTTRNNQTVTIDGRNRKVCSLWLRYVPDNDRSND